MRLLFLRRKYVKALLGLLVLSLISNIWIMNVQHSNSYDDALPFLNSQREKSSSSFAWNNKHYRNPQHKAELKQQILKPRVASPPLLSSIVSGYNITGDASWLLNYAIIGFPKTGTSSMMNYFHRFQESQGIYIFQEERCELGYNQQAKLIKALYNELPGISKTTTTATTTTATNNIIRIIKCPRDLEVNLAMSNYETYFPKTDFLVGLRHPVEWFESFYNFRIHNQFNMPPAEELIGRCKRRNIGLCTFRANFHLFLANLGKTNILNDPKELSLIDPQYRKLLQPIINEKHNDSHRDDANSNNTNQTNLSTPKTTTTRSETRRRRIFLWELSQLHSYKDGNDGSSADSSTIQFQNDLHRFLFPTTANTLQQKITQSSFPPMVWNKPGLDYTKKKYAQNITQEVNRRKIDICDAKYNHLRSTLLNHSRDASQWIRHYFLKSKDVFVSNPDYFSNVILKRWEQDPCHK